MSTLFPQSLSNLLNRLRYTSVLHGFNPKFGSGLIKSRDEQEFSDGLGYPLGRRAHPPLGAWTERVPKDSSERNRTSYMK